jgi:hypothetical protein
MGLLDWLSGNGNDPAAQAAPDRRHNEILTALQYKQVPPSTRARLNAAQQGQVPWIATLTPAELLLMRSHGIKPISTVSATCWLHYGWSWTEGHAQGWETALQRLRDEAVAAGANAVLDVKMRTVDLDVEDSMDFTLVGTAVRVDGLPRSQNPLVATVPALEFIKLLDADIVPVGIAIGAHYDWMTDWRGATNLQWMGNIECQPLTRHWESVRKQAHAQLRQSARSQGNGVLAHVNFGQMFEREQGETKQYLARHIVVATVIDTPRRAQMDHAVQIVVDLRDGDTPLLATRNHHQSYMQNDEDGAI